MPPVLETPRLSLRQAGAEDGPFMLELMNERPYLENIGDRGVRTVADARKYIEDKYASSYAQHGYGLCVVELKEDRSPVGICGLVRRGALDGPDIGFAFLQRHWSKGFAAEAAGATLEHARRALALRRLYAVVSPRNTRSIRLLGSLGFRRVRPLQIPGQALESDLYETELKPD